MTMLPTYVVKLRTKAIEGLELKQDTSAQNRLCNFIATFRENSQKDAFRTIFALVYGSDFREDILQRFGFTSSEENSDNYSFLNDNQIILLGNELRYQYKQSNPNFLEVGSSSDFPEQLEALRKVMSCHPLLFFRAVENCNANHKYSDIVSTCVELLTSNVYESELYGLKKLGHNSQYQKLLQPYSKEIANLLQAMHTCYEEQQKFLAQQEELSKFPSPFAQLSEMLKEKGRSLPEEQSFSEDQTIAEEHPAENTTEVNNNFSKYSLSDELSKFIKNRGEIIRNLPRDEEFWACLKKLRSLGINLNALLDKEEYLWPILEAHDSLNVAIEALYDANQAFEKAQKNFVMGDFKTIQELFTTGKSNEEAKAAYNKAFDKFLSCCKAYEEVA